MLASSWLCASNSKHPLYNLTVHACGTCLYCALYIQTSAQTSSSSGVKAAAADAEDSSDESDEEDTAAGMHIIYNFIQL
jgi:hypothetical protein